MGERSTENESKVEAAAEAMRSSRLAWGLHSDLMRDTERSRAFWTEAATVALAAVGVIPPGVEGRSDPNGGDGYVPGAWDEVRSAYLDGHISGAAYDALRARFFPPGMGSDS